MARPKLPDTERRSHVLQVRLTRAEKALLERGGKAAGTTATDVLRTAGLAECARLIGRSRA